jgi:hypothetical protein
MAVIAKLHHSSSDASSTPKRMVNLMATVRPALGRKRRLDAASDDSDDQSAMFDQPTWKSLRIDDDNTLSIYRCDNGNGFTKDVVPRRRSSLSSSSSSRSSSPILSCTDEAVSQQDPRSVSPAADTIVDCLRLPIRKRYLRACLYAAHKAATLNASTTGDSHMDCRDATPPAMAPVQPESDPAAFSRESRTTCLPSAVKPPCLRAGVIRHSSNPQRCLAFYYMPKIY